MDHNIYVNKKINGWKNIIMRSLPKNVNITRIAEEAGLSIASVSRAMNGRSGVSEDVRKKVNALLVKHNYVANSHLHRNKRIAVIAAPQCFGSYLTELLGSFSDTAEKHDIEFCIICCPGGDRNALLEEARKYQCSGVIVTVTNMFRDAISVLMESEIKVVLIDNSESDERVGFIDHDSYSGSRDAVRHLLALGHSRIGYLRYSSSALAHLKRFKGYEHALKEAGIEAKPAWCAPAGQNYEEHSAAARKLLTDCPELTALVATDDEVAFGAMRAARELRLRVPEDLSIVGFGNQPQSAFLTPALTTVNYPLREIGRRAIRELELSLRDPSHPLPREIMPVNLIIRESTCPPSKL